MNKHLPISKDICNIIGKYNLPIIDNNKRIKNLNFVKMITTPIFICLTDNYIYNMNEITLIDMDCYNFDKHLIVRGPIYWEII
jgi:hypothetical protein